MDVTLVIPVHNQLSYTQRCLDSLNACGCPDTAIVIVDNASTDGTAEYLARRPDLRVLTNTENRACAAAWNQGFAASQTKWTLFLNNDVVVTEGWLENLVAFATKNGLGIASPSMGEGELDYDLAAHARTFTSAMCEVKREDFGHGVAFLVSREVFDKIGNFDENFRWGGNEDDDFFRRAQLAGFRFATTGTSYVHHFLSITQNALKARRGSTRDETIRYYRAKWKIGWWQRRVDRFRRKRRATAWVRTELDQHGRTLLAYRRGGQFIPR